MADFRSRTEAPLYYSLLKEIVEVHPLLRIKNICTYGDGVTGLARACMWSGKNRGWEIYMHINVYASYSNKYIFHSWWWFSRSVVSDSVRPHELMKPARLLHPWDSPGKNAGVCCHFLLQGIFLTQESNPCLLHCR